MSVLSKRGVRKLPKVLEDRISEDWSDSSYSDEVFTPRTKSTRAKKAMEHTKSDTASSTTSEHAGTSSEDERISSRMSCVSTSSTSTDYLPPPPIYESLVQSPVRDRSNRDTRWNREIDEIVGDLDRKTSLIGREGYATLPNAKGISSGTRSYVHAESSTSSRRSISPPGSSSSVGTDRDFDWHRSLLSDDEFFSDSRLRPRSRGFGGRPFGGLRSAFGEDIDRFFGRGTFRTGWDTFPFENSFSDFGRSSNLSSRNHTRSRDVLVTRHDEDYRIEVDVQGFEPHELLVKTVGKNLLVMAKSEVSNGDGEGANREHEFRELRREFTIPSNVNPAHITSNLTPEGVLVIEALTGENLSIMSREGGDEKDIPNA